MFGFDSGLETRSAGPGLGARMPGGGGGFQLQKDPRAGGLASRLQALRSGMPGGGGGAYGGGGGAELGRTARPMPQQGAGRTDGAQGPGMERVSDGTRSLLSGMTTTRPPMEAPMNRPAPRPDMERMGRPDAGPTFMRGGRPMQMGGGGMRPAARPMLRGPMRAMGRGR